MVGLVRPPPDIPNGIFTIERESEDVCCGFPCGCHTGGNGIKPMLVEPVPNGLYDLYSREEWKQLVDQINRIHKSDLYNMNLYVDE